jgi:RimJ/RimL family protein N-acetyltransferase
MATPSKLEKNVLRPAGLRDIRLVRRMIETALIESPFYSPAMKAYELKRFNLAYLYALIAADPRYVLIIQTAKGQDAGLFISGPEFGVLLNYWSYLAKPYRSGSLILRAMASFVEIWEGQGFHKTVAFVRCDNIQPQKILEKVGYLKIAQLEAHIFGENYFQLEYRFEKGVAGYAPHVNYGLAGRLRAWLYLLWH